MAGDYASTVKHESDPEILQDEKVSPSGSAGATVLPMSDDEKAAAAKKKQPVGFAPPTGSRRREVKL